MYRLKKKILQCHPKWNIVHNNSEKIIKKYVFFFNNQIVISKVKFYLYINAEYSIFYSFYYIRIDHSQFLANKVFIFTLGNNFSIKVFNIR